MDWNNQERRAAHLAKIYDPQGLPSPVMLIGKQLYRDICDKIPWDIQLLGPLLERWKDWNSTLTENLTVTRTLAPYHQPILSLSSCIWWRQCKVSQCCGLCRCPSRSRDYAATHLRKVKACQEEPNNTKTRAGRWTHGREPCNKCASSLEPSTTRSSLLAGLSCGALLDQGSGGVSKICLKQSAQDPATQTSQVASCPDWGQSSRPGELRGRCSEQPPLETQSRLAQCSFNFATCHYTKTYSWNHGRSQR